MSDGGPAFPVVRNTIEVREGMSLRDWFAGQALVAWVGAYSNPNTLPFSRSYLNEAAEMAYLMADAMLAARAVKPEGNP